MFRKKKKNVKKSGQTFLEFAVLFVVLVAAFFAMQKYIQRGVQGKWKESVDSMSKQYDPAADITVFSHMTSDANTVIDVRPEAGGYRTWRTDTMNMLEDKREETAIDGL